jgi:hypothetical protein
MCMYVKWTETGDKIEVIYSNEDYACYIVLYEFQTCVRLSHSVPAKRLVHAKWGKS